MSVSRVHQGDATAIVNRAMVKRTMAKSAMSKRIMTKQIMLGMAIALLAALGILASSHTSALTPLATKGAERLVTEAEAGYKNKFSDLPEPHAKQVSTHDALRYAPWLLLPRLMVQGIPAGHQKSFALLELWIRFIAAPRAPPS